MLVTLVAVLCNGQLCLEKVVTNSDQSGITMTACQVNGQIGIADWLANGPYHEWTLQRYKCVLGKYIPRSNARSARQPVGRIGASSTAKQAAHYAELSSSARTRDPLLRPTRGRKPL